MQKPKLYCNITPDVEGKVLENKNKNGYLLIKQMIYWSDVYFESGLCKIMHLF